MSTGTVLVALEVLTQATLLAHRVATLIRAAQAEGREVADHELDALAEGDDVARAILYEAIAAARARQGGV